MSPKTANKHNILTDDDAASSSSAAICAEDSMQATVNLVPSDAVTSDCRIQDGAAIAVADDHQAQPETDKSLIEGTAEIEHRIVNGDEVQSDTTDASDAVAASDTTDPAVVDARKRSDRHAGRDRVVRDGR